MCHAFRGEEINYRCATLRCDHTTCCRRTEFSFCFVQADYADFEHWHFVHLLLLTLLPRCPYCIELTTLQASWHKVESWLVSDTDSQLALNPGHHDCQLSNVTITSPHPHNITFVFSLKPRALVPKLLTAEYPLSHTGTTEYPLHHRILAITSHDKYCCINIAALTKCEEMTCVLAIGDSLSITSFCTCYRHVCDSWEPILQFILHSP